MPKVLVAGDANVDLIVPFPRFLNDQRTLVEYPNPCLVGGGTCANTAVALSRLGVETGFAGTIGRDQYGAYIKKDFEKEGVDTTCLIEDAAKNTVCVFAFIDEQGERYLWGWPRVDQAFKEIDLKRMGADWMTEALTGPSLRAHPCPVSLQADWTRPMWRRPSMKPILTGWTPSALLISTRWRKERGARTLKK